MNKFISLIIISSMLISLLPISIQASTMIKITLDGNDISNGKAYIENGITYYPKAELSGILSISLDFDGEFAPLRKACEDAGKSVLWDNNTKSVIITSKNIIGGKYYIITNVGTGKALAVVDYSAENNGKLTTVDIDTENENQVWRLGINGDMIFNISNAVSGKAIDVPGASREEGKNLITYTPNGNSNQSWKFTEVEKDIYTLSALHSNLYMDAEGEILTQKAANGSDYQKWTLTFVKDSMLSRVLSSEGFKLVAPVIQDGFKRYMFGTLPLCYTVANNAENYFTTNKFEEQSPALQAEMIKTVTSYTASWQVTGDKLHRESAEYEIISKTVDDNYDIWRGSREKCWIYSVEMKGDTDNQLHKFIVASNEEDAAMVTKMIEALGCFPYAERQYVNRLVWKKGDTANSYNGGGGAIYARLTYEPSFEAVVQTFAHELGHILDFSTLEDARIWSYAEAMDAIPVSTYGSSNQLEDLAEFHRLFWYNKDRDTEDELYRIYPNRSKVLRGLLYRADNVYFAEYAPFEGFIKEIYEKIQKASDDETASKFDISKYYKIIDKNSNLAWTIENASKENSAKLILSEYTGADNQLFYIENSSGLVKFFNKNSQIPIQLHSSAMYNKPLTQYGGTWSVDERLHMLQTADGNWVIMSGRYNMGITAVTEGIGEDFSPYVSQDAESDIWIIEPVSQREDIKKYTIKNNANFLAGDNNLYFTDTENEGTTWLLQAVGDAFTIVNPSSGKAIDISGGSTSIGAKLISYSLSKNDNQLFFMEKASGENEYCLKMKHSGLYLTVNSDGTITQEEKSNSNSQLFTFNEIKE